tara:strand:+ start:181 stop:336 length:156 start_codon:yes stop_codon:yes gene_type:complete
MEDKYKNGRGLVIGISLFKHNFDKLDQKEYLNRSILNLMIHHNQSKKFEKQ